MESMTKTRQLLTGLALLCMGVVAQASTQESAKLEPGERPWMIGIRDSTGVANTGSASITWDAGSWSSCNAPSKRCGRSSGTETRTVECRAQYLDGSVAAVLDSHCNSVTAEIGLTPIMSQSCSKNWGRCTPRRPRSGGGGGDQPCTGALCDAYQETFGREPDDGGYDWWTDWGNQPGNEIPSDDFQARFEDGATGDDENWIS